MDGGCVVVASSVDEASVLVASDVAGVVVVPVAVYADLGGVLVHVSTAFADERYNSNCSNSKWNRSTIQN